MEVGTGVLVGVVVGAGRDVTVGVWIGVAVAPDVGLSVGVEVDLGNASRAACNRAWTVASISGVGVDVGVGWAVRMAASMVACRSVVVRDSPSQAAAKATTARAVVTRKSSPHTLDHLGHRRQDGIHVGGDDVAVGHHPYSTVDEVHLHPLLPHPPGKLRHRS